MPWYSPYDSPTPRKKRKDPPPPPPSLTRVDTLTPNDIRVHLDAYFDAIDRKTTRELRFDGHTHGVGLVTLNTLYFERAFLTPRDVTVPHLFDRVKQRQRLYEVMAWKLLREKYRQRYFSRVKRNNLATCADVLGRAASFLMGHYDRLSFATPLEELLEIVEGCMRILCELKGVNPATASAIVASWTPVGIFESEALVKNLLGLNVDSDEMWAFYRRFDKKAIEALKTLHARAIAEGKGRGRIWNGKEMEKCAWSMFHPPPPPSKGKNGKKWEDDYDDEFSSNDFLSSEETIETTSSEEEWYEYVQNSYDRPKKNKSKKRKTTEDWIEEAKKVGQERGQPEDGKRRSKRIKAKAKAAAS